MSLVKVEYYDNSKFTGGGEDEYADFRDSYNKVHPDDRMPFEESENDPLDKRYLQYVIYFMAKKVRKSTVRRLQKLLTSPIDYIDSLTENIDVDQPFYYPSEDTSFTTYKQENNKLIVKNKKPFFSEAEVKKQEKEIEYSNKVLKPLFEKIVAEVEKTLSPIEGEESLQEQMKKDWDNIYEKYEGETKITFRNMLNNLEQYLVNKFVEQLEFSFIMNDEEKAGSKITPDDIQKFYNDFVEKYPLYAK